MLNEPVLAGSEPAASATAQFQGFIDERSEFHVSGWLRNLSDLSERVPYQVYLTDTGEVVATGVANQVVPAMRGWEGDDGQHGFYARLPRPLSPADRGKLAVRPPAGQSLPLSDWVVEEFMPCSYIIMDLVDNCNLRCPFCLYDYSQVHKTHMMTQETFDAVVQLAGRVTPGNFWFSCLHEPTLHPRLMAYIDQVPRAFRNRIFFTSNLAKRMPPAFFERLAGSGLHHINVSIESRDPAIYERMRRGARHRIFQENWDHLVRAFNVEPAPPTLRYISLAYKSNFRELPDLIKFLLNDRAGVQVEVRATYDFWHIAREFRAAEYMNQAEWLWLRDQLADYPPEQLLLELPAGIDSPDFDTMLAASLGEMRQGPAPEMPKQRADTNEPPPDGYLRGRYGMRVSWDGALSVHRPWGWPSPAPGPELVVAETNVCRIPDVDAFLCDLPI